MRVLFATDHIHVPQGGGGGERNTDELCLALKGAGDEPAVMCSLAPDGSPLAWSNRLRRALPPRPLFPADRRCGYPAHRGWSKHGAAEVAARFRPDVAVIQSTHPAALLRGFAACGVPCAAYFHEVAEIGHLAALAPAPAAIIANSPFTAARLRACCGLDAQVVLPLVDPERYRTEGPRDRVLFVNTVARKGLETAFALARARPDIGFDFVTSWILSGEALAGLRRRAEEAGNVTLHAPVSDMRRLYGRARIVLAPSQWEETWGRVATEAHVNGIPVLGSDRGGLPDAIGPGGAVVAADAPAEDWAAALSRLWDDPGAYAAASAAARRHAAREEIAPAAIVAKLRGILSRVAFGRTGMRSDVVSPFTPLPPERRRAGQAVRYTVSQGRAGHFDRLEH